jgi:hypothetical protein
MDDSFPAACCGNMVQGLPWGSYHLIILKTHEFENSCPDLTPGTRHVSRNTKHVTRKKRTNIVLPFGFSTDKEAKDRDEKSTTIS